MKNYFHFPPSISSSWTLKSLWMATAAIKSEDVCLLAGKLDKPRQYVKKQRHSSANKGA